ncbi:MAG: F0F1 ATP synthase subunit delta [Treponema sp.]|jgi:F-type H+-transporting ATPase subunit delta|nr:F0F1 ATP synthase subunit delta [Treponema sp.]
MFSAERWALAFSGALGGAPGWEQVEEGLSLLRVLVPLVKPLVPKRADSVFAARLEKSLRLAMEQTGIKSRGAEYARRLLGLLARKNCFHRSEEIIRALEDQGDRLKGTLPVVLESAVPPEQDFQDALKLLLQRKTGAREIRLEARINPALLGGYRLRIHSILIDGSLRRQLHQMESELRTGPGSAGFSPAGGPVPGGIAW